MDRGKAVIAEALVYVFQLNGDRANPGLSVAENLAFTIPANPMSDRGQHIAYQIGDQDCDNDR